MQQDATITFEPAVQTSSLESWHLVAAVILFAVGASFSEIAVFHERLYSAQTSSCGAEWLRGLRGA
jgi:hypothetical protein